MIYQLECFFIKPNIKMFKKYLHTDFLKMIIEFKHAIFISMDYILTMDRPSLQLGNNCF